MVFGAAAVAVIGAVGVTATRPNVEAAIGFVDPISIESTGSGPLGLAGAPTSSEDGTIVAFQFSGELNANTAQVALRDRNTDRTAVVAEIPSYAPGISGDGCVVAYTVPIAGGGVQLTAVNRCAQPPTRPPADPLPTPSSTTGTTTGDTVTVVDDSFIPWQFAPGMGIDTVSGIGTFAPPVLNQNGSVLAWSTGNEVRRYELSEGAYVLAQLFDSTVVSAPTIATAAAIDISADGGTVAFAAGPGAPYSPLPSNVYVWSLAGDVSGAPAVELASTTAAGDPGAGNSLNPALSGDGSLLLYESSSQDLAATGGSPAAAPFVVMLDRGKGARVLADSATSPAISADGRHAVYERAGAIWMTSWVSGDPYSGVAVVAITDPAGSGGAGQSLTGPVVSQFGRWVIFDSAAGVKFTTDARLQNSAQVWAADVRPAGGGIADQVPSPALLPPTVPPDGGGETPGSPVTVPVGTVPPPTVSPGTPSGPVFPIPGLPTRPPIVIPVAPPQFEPSAIEFEPTITDSGRQVATARLSNRTASSITVQTIGIDPAIPGPFAVLSETCTAGPLLPGGSCTIEVEFTPSAVGDAFAFLKATMLDGSVATASLSGGGSAEPTLEAVPEVAAPGQVVTVFGAGFPANSTVEVVVGGLAGTEPASVDPDGTFAYVLVLMSRASAGPIVVEVAGQPGQYPDVATEILVSGSGSGSSGAAFRDGVARPFGN